MRAMFERYCKFSSVKSMRRIVVISPTMKFTGSTAATKGRKNSGEREVKPIATSELDKASM